MDKDTYLRYFRENRDAILAAGELGLDRPVKGCPGWDVAALVGHVGVVHTFWLNWIRTRPNGPTPETGKQLLAERETLLPGFTAWRDAGFSVEARPETTAIWEFVRKTGDELESRLRELTPEDTVWTFIPGAQTGSFISRRIAVETGVHRWDAEEAVGPEAQFDRDLARDGIDEMLETMLPRINGWGEVKSGREGQRFRFVQHDGAGRWLVTFGPELTAEVGEDEAPVDVTITGSASDLLLFVMGRRSVDEMGVAGDRELAARWGDLAGNF